jgi:flagellar biosynthesis anti-sigma factor FlgM
MAGIDTSGGMADIARLAASATTPVTGTTSQSPVDPTAPVAGTAADVSSSPNLISLLADAAPPIDSKKVEAIQQLLAAGAYPIDPHQIAAKMMALDLPFRSDTDAEA